MPTGPLALYESRLNDATPVASTTGAGYDVLNLRDLRDYSFWQPTAQPSTVTVASAGSVDYWGLYGHNCGSKGVTVELRKSNDGFAANDVLVDTYTPANDKPFVRVLASSSGTGSWRLRFVNGTVPTIAIALLGNRLEFPAPLAQPFDPLGYALAGQVNKSVKGRALGRVINYRDWKQELVFEKVSWAWVRATWQPAAVAWLDSQPWLFAWNVDAYPNEVYQVSIDQEVGGWSTPHLPGSLCDLHLPVDGVMPF
jgi:hypothetical protein